METRITDSNIALGSLSNTLLKGEDPFAKVHYMPRKPRTNHLLSVCHNWLDRERKNLLDYVGEQEMQEFDEMFMYEILHELDELYKLWLLRVKLPVDIKGGFIPFFYHLAVAGTILKNVKQSTTASQVEECCIKYLHEEGELFPIERIDFGVIGNERELFKEYVECILRKHAYKTKNPSLYIEGSTEWLSNLHRQEVLEIELGYYEINRIIFDNMPSASAQILKDYVSAFFAHMLRHTQVEEALYNRIDEFFHYKDLETKKRLTREAIQNLSIPQLNKNGRPSYREVYEYIRSRKKIDPDFAKMCQEESSAFVCRQLSDIFGWDVDDNSLRQYLGRKQKYLTIATIK